jgi:predicted nucleotidyltransferase/competence protein ComGC
MNFTKSEQAILKYLGMNSGESLYESQIAQYAKTSAGSTNQSLKKLLKKGMVLLEKKGNMNFYTINIDNPLVKQFKISQTIASLNGLINKLKLVAKRIILFGSCAEGIDSQNSDIDLAIISHDEQAARKIVKKEKVSKEIQALIFTTSDFMALDKNDKPLYERIQKGITLWRQE